MFNNDTIEVSITYGTPVKFFLRMIGIAEENELRQKTFGLDEKEKAEKEYSNNVQILADLSTRMPEGLFANKPEEMTKREQAESDETFIEDFHEAKKAIEFFFKEKSILKERIAFYAVRAYFVRLSPSDFF